MRRASGIQKCARSQRLKVRSFVGFPDASGTSLVMLLLWAPWMCCAMDNGVGRVPPLGWNTWVPCGDSACSHDVCNEAEVKAAAVAMKQNGMQALGWNYINVDDWYSHLLVATTLYVPACCFAQLGA